MTTPFDTQSTQDAPLVTAPDGSTVRILTATSSASSIHVRLQGVSITVQHKTVDEIWYVTAGMGEMWRLQNDREETVPLQPGVSVSIPVGTTFQFRSTGDTPLEAVCVTIPPWPGEDEAIVMLGAGPWEPSQR
jgi:mannose-6-phosphate isomerase-like protein (cupin superfamily)